MTQREHVLAALRMGPVCGTAFLQMFIPRYSARINELRHDGFAITKRACQMHDHASLQYVYELEEPDQMSLPI